MKLIFKTALLLILPLIVWAALVAVKSYIDGKKWDEVDAANFCDTAADCVALNLTGDVISVRGVCPYDLRFVAKNKLSQAQQQIKALVNCSGWSHLLGCSGRASFSQKCTGVLSPDRWYGAYVTCERNRCVGASINLP